MASTFLKNWFNGPKNSSSVKTKEITTNKEVESPPPLPPDRRLSISKSGKMKRKNYNKQTSVKDTSLFAEPLGEKNKCVSERKNSEQVDNIDDVIAEMLKTVENTKS